MTTCFRQMKIVAVFLCGLCLQGMVPSAAAQSRDAQNEGKSLSQLVADLKDRDPAVREQAAKALGALGRRSPADVVKPLAEVLQDENAKVRLAAVIALGSIGPNAQEALPALKLLLEDGDGGVRRAAVGVIRRITPRNVPDRPRDTTPKPAPPHPTKLHNGKTVDQWLEQLKSANEKERVEAAYQLVNYRPSAHIPVEPIVAALKDPSAKVRADAASAISNLGPRAKAAVQPLIELLEDPNFEVHSAAVDALGNIGPEAAEAVAPLILKLAKNDTIELKHVVDALGRIDRKGQSVQPLIIVLKRRNLPGDGLNRYKAAVALGNIGANAKDAIPELLAFLRNDDDYRDGAAEALGKLGKGNEQVAAALAAALKDSSVLVRKTAVISLGLIGPVSNTHLPAIKTLLNDPDEDVRQAAAATVQRLSRGGRS